MTETEAHITLLSLLTHIGIYPVTSFDDCGDPYICLSDDAGHTIILLIPDSNGANSSRYSYCTFKDMLENLFNVKEFRVYLHAKEMNGACCKTVVNPYFKCCIEEEAMVIRDLRFK